MKARTELTSQISRQVIDGGVGSKGGSEEWRMFGVLLLRK